MTPFERAVAIAFELHKGKPAHSHLLVTLDYDKDGPYNAGTNGAKIPASLDIFPIDPDEDPLHCMEVARAFFGAPRETVMILDLHGAPLAEQIPEWKPGTMATPDQDRVDDIGEALGVPRSPDEEFRPSSEILESRDRNRWDDEDTPAR